MDLQTSRSLSRLSGVPKPGTLNPAYALRFEPGLSWNKMVKLVELTNAIATYLWFSIGQNEWIGSGDKTMSCRHHTVRMICSHDTNASCYTELCVVYCLPWICAAFGLVACVGGIFGEPTQLPAFYHHYKHQHSHLQ